MTVRALEDVDLPAAAMAEYRRRKQAWERQRDDAPDRDSARRIVDRANADIRLWIAIVEWFDRRMPPDDPHACARSARTTLARMHDSGKVTNETFVAMAAITRRLELDAQIRALVQTWEAA